MKKKKRREVRVVVVEAGDVSGVVEEAEVAARAVGEAGEEVATRVAVAVEEEEDQEEDKRHSDNADLINYLGNLCLKCGSSEEL